MSVKTIRNAEGKRVRVRDFGAHDVAKYVPAKVKDRMPHQGAKEKLRRVHQYNKINMVYGHN